MTPAERELLLAVASILAKLADDAGRVADSQEIRDLMTQVEREERDR